MDNYDQAQYELEAAQKDLQLYRWHARASYGIFGVGGGVATAVSAATYGASAALTVAAASIAIYGINAVRKSVGTTQRKDLVSDLELKVEKLHVSPQLDQQ